MSENTTTVGINNVQRQRRLGLRLLELLKVIFSTILKAPWTLFLAFDFLVFKMGGNIELCLQLFQWR